MPLVDFSFTRATRYVLMNCTLMRQQRSTLKAVVGVPPQLSVAAPLRGIANCTVGQDYVNVTFSPPGPSITFDYDLFETIVQNATVGADKIFVTHITNKTNTSFRLVLSAPPLVAGYVVRWGIDYGTPRAAYADPFYLTQDLRVVYVPGGGKMQGRNSSTGVWTDVAQWTVP